MHVLRSLVVAVVAFVVLANPSVVLADGRVALVVGNSTYSHIGRLPNPDNDARDISAALRRLGFEVTIEFDADLQRADAGGVRAGGGTVPVVVCGSGPGPARDRPAARGGLHPHASGVGADGETAPGRHPGAVLLAPRCGGRRPLSEALDDAARCIVEGEKRNLYVTTSSLAVRIGSCLADAMFVDCYRRRLDSPAMRHLHEAEQYCPLLSTEAITLRQKELRALVDELEGSLGIHKSPLSGSVGNGLYLLMGTSGSPKLPSVEDYAKILVLAASRVGTDRVAELFAGWLRGAPIRSRSCAMVMGIETEGVLESVEGMRLETLKPTPRPFGTSTQIDEYGKRVDRYKKRAMLTIEYETTSGLYDPESFRERFPHEVPRALVNPKLKSLTFYHFCRAMSLQVNGFVDWFAQRNDYGEVEAFSLQPTYSGITRNIPGRSTTLVSEDDVQDCLRIHQDLLSKSPKLDLPVARWLRSKRSPAAHEQLIELRIAMESLLLKDDNHRGEMRHRVAVHGARFLAGTLPERKKYFNVLRDAYDHASAVIHGGTPKKGRDIAEDIAQAQHLCRKAILRMAGAETLPDWSEVVLGP